MTNELKAYYAGVHRVMIDGIPCRVPNKPQTATGMALIRQGHNLRKPIGRFPTASEAVA